MMRAVILGFLCGVAGACALLPRGGDAQSRRALLDAYAIAHGMADTYEQEPDSDPAVTAALARLDKQARDAIGDLRNGPERQDESERAVAALSDLAAAQNQAEAAR